MVAERRTAVRVHLKLVRVGRLQLTDITRIISTICHNLLLLLSLSLLSLLLESTIKSFKDSNFENEGQPEIAIWLPKTEVLISYKYDRHHQNSIGKFAFSTMARSSKVSPSDCDNDR